MTGTWLRRCSATALAALALGCSGSSGRFSPAAAPLAVRMREAIAASNTSDIAGVVERARELYTARAITEGDLNLFVRIQNLGTNNSWNDAKKVLEEALAE